MSYKNFIETTVAKVIDCQPCSEQSKKSITKEAPVENAYIVHTKVMYAEHEFVNFTVFSDEPYRVGDEIELKIENVLNDFIPEWGGFEQILPMLEEHGRFISVQPNVALQNADLVYYPTKTWAFEFNQRTPALFRLLIKPFVMTLANFAEISFEREKTVLNRKVEPVSSLSDWYYQLAMSHERLRWIFERGDEFLTGYRMVRGRPDGRNKNRKLQKERTRIKLETLSRWVEENKMEEECRVNRASVARLIESDANKMRRFRDGSNEQRDHPLFPLLSDKGNVIGFDMIYKDLAKLYPKRQKV